MRKLVILDRDGVVNEDSENYIRSVDDWVPIPGSLEAIARLNKGGYVVTVATNQSGLGRGYFDLQSLNAIHARMHQELRKIGGHIDLLVFCPHRPDNNCSCRKPKPGLYREISRRTGLSLKDVPVVGDSLRDLQAADKVNAQPLLVRTGKGAQSELELDNPVPTFDTLADTVDYLLAESAS